MHRGQIAVTGQHEERIIEAGLEEILGGHYPPDLSAKILQTLEARRQAARSPSAQAALVAAAPPLSLQPALSPPPPVPASAGPAALPVPAEPLVRVEPETHRRRRSSAAWWRPAVAISLAAAAALIGLYGTQRYLVRPAGQRQVARSDTQPTAVLPVDSPTSRRPTRSAADQMNSPPRPVPSVLVAAAPAEPDPVEADSADLAIAPQVATQRLDDRPQPSPDAEVLALINDVLRNAWREHSVTPSPPASDEQWCRRVYLRLAGREPTAAELGRFQRADRQQRREQLVDQLLASGEYAQRMADLWADALLEADARPTAGDLSDQQGLVGYLKDAFHNDKPYDTLAYELLTATGSNDPAADDYNGAVNFLLAGNDPQALDDTDRTSRALLGKQLVCTRCHSHSASGWAQGDFWELNAFFRQMRVESDSVTRTARLIDQDFYGESGSAKDAEIYYELPDGRIRMAYPALGEREISHSGRLRDVNRRRELAKLLTGSPDFRRAVVNRVWAWLVGYGFTHPVDDMGPHNPPSHPELLDHLATELAARDFHPDALARWIVLSDAFGLSSKKMPESWMDNPETGGRPLFARWYETPEQVEDIYHALVHAVHSRSTASGLEPGVLARRTSLRPSVGPLEIIDTQLDDALVGPQWLPQLARSRLSAEKKVEHVFLSVLNRYPNAREMKAAKLVLADRLDDREAIQEIWQTLLASEHEPSRESQEAP
jgi:hypothetical protein